MVKSIRIDLVIPSLVIVAAGAMRLYHQSMIPNNNAAFATGFGITIGTSTIAIPFVQANACKFV